MARQTRQLLYLNFQICLTYLNHEGADYAQPLALPHLKLFVITPLKYENEPSDLISIFCEKQCLPKRITTCKVQRQFLKIGRSLLYTDCIIKVLCRKSENDVIKRACN